jgi:hypothetical protein
VEGAIGGETQVMPSRRPTAEQLQLALEIVAYELERRPEAYDVADPITALERVREAAGALPPSGVPLRESYPAVVELAVQALVALGSMPEPSDVDGMLDYAGFDLWRRQR